MSYANRWKVFDGETIIGVYDRLWTARMNARRYADENKVMVTLIDTHTNKKKDIGWKYA